MRKAFTLIELLVVIAIIAILAAILFPVFTQAKASAKKTQKLAEFKQAGTSVQIYLGDTDDVAPRGDYLIMGSSIVSPRTGATIANPQVTWCQAAQPYMKNWPVLNDAAVPDPLSVWVNSTPPQWYYNWMRWPAVGFNVNYFNNAAGDCSGWAPAPGLTSFGLPIAMTSVASPSSTIMFSHTKRVGSAAVGAYTSYNAESPASYLANDTCSWTNGGWGIGSYGDCTAASCGGPTYPGNPTSTGDYATPYANQGIVIMSDSSAKAMPAGKVAAGTNWRVGIANSAITITDRAQYIWDTQQ